ncbi:hypothetical protein SH668x_003355 [Planctomicrobium sp. SH668]|uniref:hypothetical protein n=1 Tax=Planctomicrobium sp. SH668 TaxID=3448126 RepID=UPI003F5B6C55
MPNPNRIPSPSNLIVALICLCALMTGCGQKDYEERLQASWLLHDYLNSVEESLNSPVWKRSELGVSMRLPKPFSAPLAGPVTSKSKDGKPVVGPDPRDQNILGTPVEGLADLWEAKLESSGEEPDAWFFILTNRDRFKTGETLGPPPSEYLTDVEYRLMKVFGVTIQPGETSRAGVNVRFRQSFPSPNSERAKYNTPKEYSVIKFIPDPQHSNLNLQATIYERRVGEYQVAVLVVTRKSVPPNFQQRVEIALETLEVEPISPRAAKQGGAPPSSGSAPAGAAAPNF